MCLNSLLYNPFWQCFFLFSLLQRNCPWHCVAKCAGKLKKMFKKHSYNEKLLKPTEFYFKYHCCQVFRSTKNVWILGHLDYFHVLVFTHHNKHGDLNSSSSANIIVWTKLINLILLMSVVSFLVLKLPKGRLKERPVFLEIEFVYGIEPSNWRPICCLLASRLWRPAVSPPTCWCSCWDGRRAPLPCWASGFFKVSQEKLELLFCISCPNFPDI